MLKKLTQKKVLQALATVMHPKTGKDIVASGAIDEVTCKDGIVNITMLIDPNTADIMEGVRKRCDDAVAILSGVKSVRTVMTAHNAAPDIAPQRPKGKATPPPPPPKPKPIPGIKRILAVASGKGGVGKSTTSVNLAAAFKTLGWNVGLFDCDIFGPSVQKMLGEGDKPDFTKNDMIRPVERHGIKAISMGYLVPEGRATVWRGPMVIGAVQQLLNGVAWTEDGDLDILIVDLPPGTGDAQLTLVQTVPVTGTVIVSTPQDIALIDARKAYDMF
ncbi:MAG: P-loop NTPase, partial [Robiginitomaculum sp.]